VDGHHWDPSVVEEYRISHYSGPGGYRVGWSAPGASLNAAGLYGPYGIGSSEVVKALDLPIGAGATRRVAVIPTVSNSADLGVSLVGSNAADPATWARGRSSALLTSDAFTATTAVESFGYRNSGAADTFGLIVHTRNSASAQFYILVADTFIYMPLVFRQ
jgi:hypothetical protein